MEAVQLVLTSGCCEADVEQRSSSSTLLTVPTVQNLKFPKFKMAADAILKNRKVTYLRRGLSDFDKIWHSDAVRPF